MAAAVCQTSSAAFYHTTSHTTLVVFLSLSLQGFPVFNWLEMLISVAVLVIN